jgi:AraC-like DNA-binding protein
MMLWMVEWAHGQLPRLHRARRRDAPPPADPAHAFCRRLAAPALRRIDGLLLAAVAAQPRADAFNRGLDFALFALWDVFWPPRRWRTARCSTRSSKPPSRILADPDDSPTQAELARRVGLSPYYLSSLFQRQTGLTIPAYRNRLRLQAFFRRVHAHPEISLLRHALDSGFGSYAQFYRVFVHGLGIPPRQWLQSR